MPITCLRTLILPLVFLLCVACAPNHLLIERAELAHFDARLTQLEEHFTRLEQQHVADSDSLQAQHWMATAALMQTMLDEIERMVRDQAQAAPAVPPGPVTSAGPASNDEARQPTIRAARVEGKQLVGGTEKVLLTPPGLLLDARIDTGAESASLDARDIQAFERDGSDWVRFSILDRETEELFEVERRVVRYVRILQSSADAAERRPVVRFRVTLGEISQVAEFTLSDRSHLSFPLLIGRNVIKDVMLVDVAQSNIAPPSVPASDTVDPK